MPSLIRGTAVFPYCAVLTLYHSPGSGSVWVSGLFHNAKSPPNNIVVAQRAFLCLLLLMNNQLWGPIVLKRYLFFTVICLVRYDSVSFFKPVRNSIKTVSERLPRVLEPSVYAGLRDFANYSYSTVAGGLGVKS